MAQIIRFPSGLIEAEAEAAPTPAPKPPRKGKRKAAHADPGASPIRSYVRVPRKNREEDEETAMYARLVKAWEEQAYRYAQTEPNSENHRMALHMAGLRKHLPRNNLRCIVSTLDERRDFDLLCADVELLNAEHRLECRRLDRLSILEQSTWWDSPTLRPLAEANRDRFEAYRQSVLRMAETPARTRQQLERKRRLIGKVWLAAENEWSERLRAGVAADEAWLEANAPRKRGRS